MTDSKLKELSISKTPNDLLNMSSKNDIFTTKWFVIGSQQTDEFRFKQCLMEYNSRNDHLIDNEFNIKKIEIEIKILERDISKLDELEAELSRMEIESKKHSIKNICIKNETIVRELNIIAEIIEDLKAKNPNIENTFNSEEAAQRYWVHRLGKQAAMDLISTGHVSTGNLEAITQMSKELQEQVFIKSIEYSANVSNGIHKLQSQVKPNGELSIIDNMTPLLDSTPTQI